MSIPRRTITKTVRQYGNTTETTITRISSTDTRPSTSRIPQTMSRLPVPRVANQTSASSVATSKTPGGMATKPTHLPKPKAPPPQPAPRVIQPSGPRQRGQPAPLTTMKNPFGGQARKTAPPPPRPPTQRAPALNVYQVPQTTRGAVPKVSVKTVKTQKVETMGKGKRTVTKVTKTIKPRAPDADENADQSSPLKTPPAGPSNDDQEVPADFSFGFPSPSASIERLVEKELMRNASMSPGAPARAKGSRRTDTSAPVLQTPDGDVESSIQISLNRQVERTPDVEYIKRYMAGVEVDEQGAAKKYEYSIQDMEPSSGIGPRSDGVVPLREIISVKSTVAFAPGVKVKENTTVYESVEPDPVQISQLVEEEAMDVEKMRFVQPPDLKGSMSSVYGLKKKLQKMQLSPEAVRQLETSMERHPPISADEPPAEVQPELMAAIMHTEEKGLSMESPPANVCNFLFPDAKDDLTIKVKPVAPSPMQKVVVPEDVPSSVLTESVPPEIEHLATRARDCNARSPTDNIYSTRVLQGKTRPKINNTAKRGQAERRGYPVYISDEKPPWGVEELQPIMDLAGAAPSSQAQRVDTLNVSDNVPLFYHNEDENVLEYHLIPQPPRFTSHVQLRGSQKPSWFPGFCIALPDNIRVVTTPCDVLPAAWQAVQPDIFSDESFLIVG